MLLLPQISPSANPALHLRVRRSFFEPTLLHQLTRMGYSWVAEPFEGGLWPTQVWDAIFGRRQKGERPSCLFYCDVVCKITTSAQPTNNVAQVISPNGVYIPTSLKGKLVYIHTVLLGATTLIFIWIDEYLKGHI